MVTLSGLIFHACMIATIANVYTHSKAPYYPIEISRMAATVRGSSEANFFLGSVLSLFVWVLTRAHAVSLVDVIAPAGLLLLSAAPDDRVWFLHMVGVGVFVVGSVFATVASNDATVRTCVALGCALFVARSIARTAFCWWHDGLNAKASHQLMYTGAFPSAATRRVFQASAVAQYVSVALLAAPMAIR